MASQRLEIKFLPGTDILVDGFRFLSARAPAAVVLTHFHSDHTTGLTKAYAGPPIICTPVTGACGGGGGRSIIEGRTYVRPCT